MKIARFAILLAFFLTSCRPSSTDVTNGKGMESQLQHVGELEDSLLNVVQQQTINYFWENAEPSSGMARERTHLDGIYPQDDRNVVTSGGSGFGIMALIVGIERGFIKREDATDRFLKILNFLEMADSFHGAFPHWWYGESGQVKAFSHRDDGGDLVETAFLVQGLIAARQYFDREGDKEAEIRNRINRIWEAVDWTWFTRGEEVLYWHWSPNHGWDMNFAVRGYNECLIMYILAASSPTYPIDPEVYHKGWARNGAISSDRAFLGFPTELDHYETGDSPVGPLFWAHYSYLGLDPRGLKDQYGDYEKLNVNHTKIHFKHCVLNPNNFEGYGGKCWGLSSSYSVHGYAGHKPDSDIGVISPTAALSSFPYTPDESMDFLKFLYLEADTLIGKYGPYDAFSFEEDWSVPRYLAIDQGPIPVMIENYRTGLIWKLFLSAPEINVGLERLGFTYE